MRVLVTGGAGFIGRAVINELISTADQIVALDSLRPDVHRDEGVSARQRLAALDIELLTGDLRDGAVVTKSLSGVDAVVHLGAKVGLGVGIDDMDDYVSSNDLGTAILLRAMAGAGIVRLVQASSMVVYGEGRYTCEVHGPVLPGPRTRNAMSQGRFEPSCPLCGVDLAPGVVGEDSPMDPRNTYAASKVAQEHLGGIWARESGGSAISLRLHNVYGPGMPRDTAYAGVASILRSAIAQGVAPRVFEDGGQRRDFVHVGDVARAFSTALSALTAPTAATVLAVTNAEAGGHDQLGTHRVYNVGSGVVSTIGDLARALSISLNGRDPVVTGDFRLGDVRHITASSARIQNELGWHATVSLAEGVAGLTFG